MELWRLELWRLELWKLELWNLELWKLELWKLELWKLELWKLELWKLESGSGALGALGAGLWELELSRHKLREYMKECTKHLMKTQDACAHRQFTFYSKIDTVNLTVL